MTSKFGKIYLIPTPIGNMSDITHRALEILNEVDLIACEDTRHSGRFLKQFNIKKKLVSYHNFNELSRSQELKSTLEQGHSIAVITDAGSPGISDPAYRIARMAIDNGFELSALPGANALIPALTASGLPTDRFFFEGFLPNKTIARKKRLEKLKEFEHTIVFYESPHRIKKSLDDILFVFGNREICIAREISKKFEEYLRGNVSDIIEQLESKTVKGEIVLVVKGKKD
ncbi:16S rRNA (cytidine(1402)-2'-O)-methyltransferase [Candidatus Zixiibacteriota bacterium]